jgi:hypothetical protein
MDPRKFWTACRVHDWHYEMSDDPEVYRMGSEADKHLSALAASDPKLRAIHDAWYQHHHNCGPRPAEPSLED